MNDDPFDRYMGRLADILDELSSSWEELGRERSHHKHQTNLDRKRLVDSTGVSNAKAEMEVYASKEWLERDQKVSDLEVRVAVLKMRSEIGHEWINIQRTREATARRVY